MEIVKLADRRHDLSTIAKRIVAEWGGSSAEEVALRLTNPTGCPETMIAVEQNIAVGVLEFSRFTRDGDRLPSLWINVLYVVPGRRGWGIGTALLSEAMVQAERFEKRVFVYTEAASFYERRGWSVLEQDLDSSLSVLARPTAGI